MEHHYIQYGQNDHNTAMLTLCLIAVIMGYQSNQHDDRCGSFGNYISDLGEQTNSSYRKLLKGIGSNKANITNLEYTRVLPTIKNGMVLLEEKCTFARNITS